MTDFLKPSIYAPTESEARNNTRLESIRRIASQRQQSRVGSSMLRYGALVGGVGTLTGRTELGDNPTLNYAVGAGLIATAALSQRVVDRYRLRPNRFEKHTETILAALPSVKGPDGEDLETIYKRHYLRASNSGSSTEGTVNRQGMDEVMNDLLHIGGDGSRYSYMPSNRGEDPISSNVLIARRMLQAINSLSVVYNSLSQISDETLRENIHIGLNQKFEALDAFFPLEDASGYSSWGEYIATVSSDEASMAFIQDSLLQSEDFFSKVRKAHTPSRKTK